MRYQVPQFVDIADKIIGPFTLKQFLIYLAAVLSLIPVYLLSDLSLFITVAMPVLGIAVAFAHVKINGKSLAVTLVYGFRFYTNNQLYIWRRQASNKPILIIDKEWEELTVSRDAAAQELNTLTTIAQSLETSGNTVKSEIIEDPFDTTTQV